MIVSGLTILAFIIFHLLHFTVRVNSHLAGLGETDPYGMVIAGFAPSFLTFLVVLFYIIAMTLLCSHLSHGVASMFQTLGLRSKKRQRTDPEDLPRILRHHLGGLHLRPARDFSRHREISPAR